MEKQLEVKSLTVGFRSGKDIHNAVTDVSFYLNRGETLCIVGESGCGKSVSVSSILRLLPERSTVTSGGILFAGIDLLKADEKALDRIRGEKISMIFQEPMTSLNPSMTIGRQLMESLNAHNKYPKKQSRQICEKMLAEVGIHDAERCMKSFPHEFSGGMRQRVMIAMAMICKPEILIADEPTTALDVTVQAQILALMRRLKNEYGTSIIFITHDTNLLDLNILRRDEIQFMEKDREKSASYLTNYAEFKIIPGLNLEKGYLDGRFGAIPLLQSHNGNEA